ncbi:MarR family transcriptional regulator [Kitasatospora sp. NPDC048545]|uniref:MarR family winged helix-turn-helix transcriptional regulator n=1 Tax=Kitasatospora sp. NPDC048545 TaxID=3157208 RepID=UPI00340F01A0
MEHSEQQPAAGHSDHVARIQAQWRRERPDLDVSPLAVIGRLHRLAGRLTAELTLVYQRYGLSEGEFDALAALRRAGAPYERAPGELAAHTMVTTGAMTKRIDRLERAGLVTRRTAEDDRRGRVVALTDAGLRLIDEAFTTHIRNEHRLLAHLAPEEAAALQTLLTAWQTRLDGAGEPGDGR